VQQRAAHLGRGECFAAGDERDLDRDLFARADREQVDVEELSAAGIGLDAVDQDPVLLLAAELELEDRVRMHGPPEVVELVGVDRDGDRSHAVAEDDRGDLAGLSKVGDLFADLVSAGCLENRRCCAHGLTSC